MSPAEPLHQYEMRWYATFWDKHDKQITRVQIGQGEVAIPLGAMYMTVDTELKSSGGSQS